MQLYPPSYFDDRANGYTRIATVPLASAMGAEIRGSDGHIDIRTMDDATLAQVKDALWRYKMIFFRGQDLGIEDQEVFTQRFGRFGTDAYTKGSPGHPNVQKLIKEADTAVDRVFGEGWHTDSPFLDRPPSVSLLYGRDVPPWGGDTWFSNTQIAYEFLSDGMKQLLQGLKVHMSAREAIRLTVRTDALGNPIVGDMEISMAEQDRIIRGNYHPLLRTHPENGCKGIFVDTIYAQGIAGLSDEEARPLLDFLARHNTREEFMCRLKWTSGTLVMWDNRACLHKAFNDYDGHRREMYRTIVEGEVPA